MFHPPCEGYRAEYNQPILIARDHDSRTCAFAFGELASGSHADFQLLGFSADSWAIEVRLIQTILDAAPPRTTAMARTNGAPIAITTVCSNTARKPRQYSS